MVWTWWLTAIVQGTGISCLIQDHDIPTCTFVAKVPIREVKVPILNNAWEAEREERLSGGFMTYNLNPK